MADLATANTAANMSSADIRTSQEYLEVIIAGNNNDILPYGFTSVPALHKITYIDLNRTIYCVDLDHDFFLGCAVTWITTIVNVIVFQLQWISPMSLKLVLKRCHSHRDDCNRLFFLCGRRKYNYYIRRDFYFCCV